MITKKDKLKKKGFKNKHNLLSKEDYVNIFYDLHLYLNLLKVGTIRQALDMTYFKPKKKNPLNITNPSNINSCTGKNEHYNIFKYLNRY